MGPRQTKTTSFSRMLMLIQVYRRHIKPKLRLKKIVFSRTECLITTLAEPRLTTRRAVRISTHSMTSASAHRANLMQLQMVKTSARVISYSAQTLVSTSKLHKRGLVPRTMQIKAIRRLTVPSAQPKPTFKFSTMEWLQARTDSHLVT